MAGSQFGVESSSIPAHSVNFTSPVISPIPGPPSNSVSSQKRLLEEKGAEAITGLSISEVPKSESHVTLNSAAQENYPEGGYGWIVVVGVFVMSFWSIGFALCYGVFIEYFIDSQLFSNTTVQRISWIGALGSSCVFVAAPVIVVLDARLGTRKVLCIGIFLSSAGLILSSFSTAVWHLYFTLSIPLGLGGCILYFTSSIVLSQYFYKRRATVLSIAATGSSIGGAVLSPFIRLLLTKLDFPTTVRIIGGTLLVATGLASCVIKPRIPFSGSVPVNHDTGSTPEAHDEDEEKSFSKNTAAHPPVVVLPKPKVNIDFTIFKDLNYTLLFFATVLFALAYTSPLTLMPSYATLIGLSTTQSALLLSISSATSIGSRVALGYIGDCWGVFNTMLMCTFIAAISCLALWMPAHSFAMLGAFMGIFGAFQGSLLLLLPVAASKTVTADRMPSAMAFNFFAISVGIFSGSPLTSLVISSDHGENQWAAIFVGIIDLACFTILAIIRLRISRKVFEAV